MNEAVKYEGEVLSWNVRGKYGIIRRREGIHFIKSFLHWSQIVLCEPGHPFAGCVVKFNIDLNRLPREGHYFSATNAEVFNPPTDEVAEVKS
jgi:hypothetical protein